MPLNDNNSYFQKVPIQRAKANSNNFTILMPRGASGRKILGGQVLNRLGPPGGAKGCHTLQKSPNIGGAAAPPDTPLIANVRWKQELA